MLKLIDQTRITSRTENLKVVREFMNTVAAKTGLSPQDQAKVVLATDEAVSNIIEHAYKDNPNGEIEIMVEADREKTQITVRDTGSAFNPNEVPDVDIDKHVKAGRKNGLGVFLIRQIMDEVSYFFKNGFQNELRMVKYFKPEEKRE